MALNSWFVCYTFYVAVPIMREVDLLNFENDASAASQCDTASVTTGRCFEYERILIVQVATKKLCVNMA